MATQTRPVQNQISYHEKCNVITNAQGNIYLDLDKSTTHYCTLFDNSIIYITPPNIDDLIPPNSLIQVFVVVDSSINNKTITFDPDIRWNLGYTPILTLNLTTLMAFHFFSINSGGVWNGLLSGSFLK